jgi:hypothetical protein
MDAIMLEIERRAAGRRRPAAFPVLCDPYPKGVMSPTGTEYARGMIEGKNVRRKEGKNEESRIEWFVRSYLLTFMK